MSNFENLVVLMVDGGLCSQLVKWAFGEFLKKRHGVKVKYDISWYSSNGLDCDGKSSRRFLLQSIFPKISFDIASSIEIEAAKNNYFLNPFPYEFCANLFVDRFPAYLDGYYENVSYMNDVKDIIEKE